MTAATSIQFRRTPEIDTALDALQAKMGVNQTNVIRIAIMELAERRGVSAELAPAAGKKARKKKAR